MDVIIVIGLVAASFTTFSLLPQLIKVIRTKRTDDLSLGMYLIYTMGVFLWLVYGVLIVDIPLIVANIITFTFSFFILVMKIRY